MSHHSSRFTDAMNQVKKDLKMLTNPKTYEHMTQNQLIGALTLVLLIVGVTVGVFLGQQGQELRQQAVYDGQPCTPSDPQQICQTTTYVCSNGSYVNTGIICTPTNTPFLSSTPAAYCNSGEVCVSNLTDCFTQYGGNIVGGGCSPGGGGYCCGGIGSTCTPHGSSCNSGSPDCCYNDDACISGQCQQAYCNKSGPNTSGYDNCTDKVAYAACHTISGQAGTCKPTVPGQAATECDCQPNSTGPTNTPVPTATPGNCATGEICIINGGSCPSGETGLCSSGGSLGICCNFSNPTNTPIVSNPTNTPIVSNPTATPELCTPPYESCVDNTSQCNGVIVNHSCSSIGGVCCSVAPPTNTPLPCGPAPAELCVDTVAICLQSQGSVKDGHNCATGICCQYPPATSAPTNTPVPVPTNTSVPVPTGQPTNTPVPVATNTSVPLPTDTSVIAPICANVTVNNLSSDVAGTPPNIGDFITLTCGQVTGATRYEFALRLPDGTTQALNPSTTTFTVSDQYQISQQGTYTAVCRPCATSAESSCSPWEM